MSCHSRIRVLVAEDEFLVRMDLAQHLDDAGYETFEAGNSAEAIATLENDRSIRIVFTDIQMPGMMDGIALARYVRIDGLPTIIVISSGKFPPDMKDVPADVMIFGKPYDWSKFSRVLSEVGAKLGG